MEESIRCEACRVVHEESKMHYSPKKGISRYYCHGCNEKRKKFADLRAAQRNFRNTAPKRNTTNAKYLLF